MTSATYRGIVRGKTILLDEHLAVPGWHGSRCDACNSTLSEERGSATALLAALKTGPPVPPEWVDELELLIEQGRRPPARPNLFMDEPGSP